MLGDIIGGGAVLLGIVVVIGTVVMFVRRANHTEGRDARSNEMTPGQQERYFRQSEILGTIGIAVLVLWFMGVIFGWWL